VVHYIGGFAHLMGENKSDPSTPRQMLFCGGV
jgi:hypothetical protein